jgi:hypothetical protein
VVGADHRHYSAATTGHGVRYGYVSQEDDVNRRAAFRHTSIALVALVLGRAAAAPAVFAQNTNPTILPPNTVLFGKSYGDWSAEWWRWALSIPAATNPVADTTGANCGQGQSGQVWFLAGTFGGSVTRTCTVPAGKHLFFPILNSVYICLHPIDPDPICADVATMRAVVDGQMDNPRQLRATIDRDQVRNLERFRAQSPVFTVQMPQGNIFGVQQGAYQPSVSDGYFLLVEPLSPGAHTISFRGVSNSGFSTEVTYNLTVQ